MQGPCDSVRVVVVGGDQNLLDRTATRLERADDRLSVQTRSSASDGLARLENDDVDCIVFDDRTRDVDEVERLEEIRARRPDVPVVLFAGEGSGETVRTANDSCVDGYVERESGTEQDVVLARQITTLVETEGAERRLHGLEQEPPAADDGTGPVTADGGFYESGETFGGRSMSMAVVEAVASREGADPLHLAPLHDAIDPEALDLLFSRTSGETGSGGESVSFSYHGYTITVNDGGHVTIEE